MKGYTTCIAEMLKCVAAEHPRFCIICKVNVECRSDIFKEFIQQQHQANNSITPTLGIPIATSKAMLRIVRIYREKPSQISYQFDTNMLFNFIVYALPMCYYQLCRA